MSGLDVGTAGTEEFSLPREVATQATAILGIRGSGKTVTATVLVEEMLDERQQVVVIDPTDVWWGLKSSADGSEEGYPVVVLGGPHGDLPLEEDNAPALADFAVEQRVPLVLSLRHLRKNAQRRFMTDFCEQLYHRKGELAHRTPLLVAIDEASAFVPQKVGGAEARMVGAVEDLVRRGRSAGIGVALIDQRPASLNKDVLTQVEVLVSHQITSPQDRKALDEWVSQHDTEGHRKEFLEGLSSLPRGTAWFWSPALDVFERVGVRMRKTYDSSKTPKLGEEPEPPTAWADVDLEALRDLLSSTDEEEVSDDTDAELERLRLRIRELEEQLDLALPSGADEETTARLTHAEGAMDAARRLMSAAMSELSSVVPNSISLPTNPPAKGQDERLQPEPVPEPKPELVPTPKVVSPVTPPPELSSLPRARRRIVETLASMEALGISEMARSNLAVFSGQSPRSSAYDAHVSALKKAGVVDYPAGGGRVSLTASGRELAGGADRWTTPRSLASLHAAWFSRLPDAQGRILEVLLECHPAEVGRKELAGLAGASPRSSAYDAHVSALKSLSLIVYPRPGRVKAGDLLFPEGLQ